MRMAALLSRISQGLACSSKFRTQASHKFVSQYYQPWKRAYGTSGFKVDVRSREMIKPSSPTPDHYNTVRFSLMDQLATTCYVPILLFYKNHPSSSVEQRSMLLKKSLSETLVDFYPLAGRIQMNELVDCSDQGVEFCEAHTSEGLTKFIENPCLDDLQALLPFKELLPLPGVNYRHKNIVLSVQVNHFSCGGTAIGLCFNHKIGDAGFTVYFLKAWAAKAQYDASADESCPTPEFNGASLFPPLKELNDQMPTAEEDVTIYSESIAIRRLIFDKNAIDELKAEATMIVGPSSRAEVVFAFICKHWPNDFTSIVQVVSFRKKMVPPIPEGLMGNYFWFTRSCEFPKVIIEECRRGVEKISGNYMNDFISSHNFLLRLNQEVGALLEGKDKLILCNSITGLPLYEIDFGMGKPLWTCFPSKTSKNGVLMTSTECGKGIEAWVCMLEDDITHFDRSLSKLPYPVSKPLEIGSSFS